MSNCPFSSERELTTSGLGKVKYSSLQALEDAGLCKLEKLPFSIKILLESVLRNCDGFAFTEDHVKTIASWTPTGERLEIPYKPARVVLQDFTGVPAIVDLASMRDAMKRLGGDPSKINPLVPCDLVIDHSVQVDFSGTLTSLGQNEKLEFERNKERYEFLKWGQSALKNLRVVPPSTGIVHQVNLEYLSQGVFYNKELNNAYPDSCVGTDSHTPMVNGLGILAWGVGGIEAEAVMLDQPIYMLTPDVVGIKLVGKLPEGATATDLVLYITEQCRKIGVVEKFVEFFGPALSTLSVADRATISNMAPEQGSTVSFFPIDEKTLEYMRLSSRPAEIIELTESYCKAQGIFRTADTPDPEFSQVVELDLSNVEPALAGPKRPHDRVLLSQVGPTYSDVLKAPIGPKGLGLKESDLDKKVKLETKGEEVELTHGSVVIAAITSCTNTSNPSVMLAAGLVAKKAIEKGLKIKPYVKTSLAPGSRVVTEYLEKSGLLPYLDKLGFNVVGYGCTTCIGNSGPLAEEIETAIKENDLVVSAVLSGNRNFEGRVHPLTRTNYLASPPLVVAYALAGSTAVDITKEPIGFSESGETIYLKDIWPTTSEIEACVKEFVTPQMFAERYADVFKGSEAWQNIKSANSELYPWHEESTYIQNPPFFDAVTKEEGEIIPVKEARVLGLFGDSVTTDHISPAGSIAANSPAAKYLESKGVEKKDFNSYGARRGNDRVMVRGTFANIRLKNLLTPGKEGNHTICHLCGSETTFFEASEKYRENNVPLIVIGGKEYGSGSSRDWAAKGPYLQGVKAAIAETYERIHRSNLIGLGIIPFQFKAGENASSLGLDGTESYSFDYDNNIKPGQLVSVTAKAKDGSEKTFQVINRIDTPVETQYVRDGGILCTVLKKLAS